MNKLTLKYFSLVNSTFIPNGYQANGSYKLEYTGFLHLFSPKAGRQHCYNGSFKCSNHSKNPFESFNIQNFPKPMNNIYDVAVLGHDYKHPRKLLDNSWRNWYVSLNSFTGSRRLKKDVRAFGGFIVDCDCHSKVRSKVITTTADVFINRYVILSISRLPQPTAIISSGHGFYFVWIFEHCVPNNSPKIMRLWENVERKINVDFNKATLKIFKEKLADPNSMDPSHVYRFPGSYNNKTGMTSVPCRVQQCSGKLYSLKYWEHHYPYNRRKHKKFRFQQHQYKVRLNTPRKHNMLTLAWNIVRDLYTYLRINHYNINGYREIFLFYFMYWSYRATHNADGVIKHLYLINNKLVNHLPNNEIHHLQDELLSGVKSNSGKHINILAYRFKKIDIIHRLNITPNQQKYMLILTPSHKSIKRVKVKKLHFQKRKRRYMKVVELYKGGLNKSKIARKMKISRRTVIRIIKGAN